MHLRRPLPHLRLCSMPILPPVQSGPLVPNRPHRPKGKGRNLSRSRRLQPRPLLLRRLFPGPVASATSTLLPRLGNVALPFPDMSQLPLAPLIPQMLHSILVAM